MFLKKAMRYYRLWIYTCNAVLLVSVLVFIGVSIGILSHRYLELVPTPPLYHPSFLYGYVALFLQAGVLQAIGCLGALRLNQKLLNTYWFLLLSLLVGDIIVGLLWLVKFTHVTEGVTLYLTMSLKNRYGKDAHFTQLWDSVQREQKCCGSDSPVDYYNNLSVTIIPNSCCSTRFVGPTVSALRSNKRKHQRQPEQIEVKPTVYEYEDKSRRNLTEKLLKKINASCSDQNFVPNLIGCAKVIKSWYEDSTETLMILGFCVITFVKLCFVGILRFEIQEMIQKIKILQGENPVTPNPELAAALGMISPLERKLDGGSMENAVAEEEPTKPMAPNLFKHNHITAHSDGADSDTNSHCALITDTPIRNSHPVKRKPNGNNNDLTELRELRHLRQTQI